MSVAPGTILGMGNPLLDISTTVDEAFLAKYGLKSNDAILAEEKHMPIFTEIQKGSVDFIAGGATQNSIRVAQWMLGSPGTAYMGSVGKDADAETLKKKAEEGGTQVAYHVDEATPTGTCAVLITGKDRCLVTSLGAANNYKETHLNEVGMPIVEAAKIYYISGFFLTVSCPSIDIVGKHASANNKIFTMNLAAPFITMFFKDQLLAAMPYVDILFGNESEYAELAKTLGWGEGLSLADITKKVASLPKENGSRARTAICTQGELETIICENGSVANYPIVAIKPEDIVDTNGAGDAWVGGFLAALAHGKSTKECTESASHAASVIITRSGCTYPDTCTFKL